MFQILHFGSKHKEGASTMPNTHFQFSGHDLLPGQTYISRKLRHRLDFVREHTELKTMAEIIRTEATNNRAENSVQINAPNSGTINLNTRMHIT